MVLVVAWQGWLLIELQWPFRTPGVGIPRIAYTAPLVIGMVLVALQMIADALRPRPPETVGDTTASEAGR